MVFFSVDEVYIFTHSRKDLDVSFLRDLQLLLDGEIIGRIKGLVLKCDKNPVLYYRPGSKLVWIKDYLDTIESYYSCKTKSELIEKFIQLNYGELHV